MFGQVEVPISQSWHSYRWLGSISGVKSNLSQEHKHASTLQDKDYLRYTGKSQLKREEESDAELRYSLVHQMAKFVMVPVQVDL